MSGHRFELDWDYDDALAWMSATRDAVLNGAAPAIGVGAHAQTVVSLGRHTPEADAAGARLLERSQGAIVRRVERGGGATVHGPGQLMAYPVFRLADARLDVGSLTDALEGAAIAVLDELGIRATSDSRDRGVYVDGAKIASVGFRVHRGVVTHGLALNVNNDLSAFSYIVTCGQPARPMTSVQRLQPDVSHDVRTLALAVAQHVASVCLIRWSRSVGDQSIERPGGGSAGAGAKR